MSQSIPERPTVGALNLQIQQLQLKNDRLSERVEALRKIAILQQKQISFTQGLLRGVLTMRFNESVSPDLLINQLQALGPESSDPQLAELEGMEGWDD